MARRDPNVVAALWMSGCEQSFLSQNEIQEELVWRRQVLRCIGPTRMIDGTGVAKCRSMRGPMLSPVLRAKW